ncbi:hypothetical protein ACQP1U_06185 [Actinomycetota bacterium]
MSDATTSPEFEEWLDRTIASFPAPSPEVAQRLVGLLAPEEPESGAPAEDD